MTSARRPRVGLLGIMQELYDDMIPGITEHQAAYAEAVAARLGSVAEVVFRGPARCREDVEARVRELTAAGVDGIAIVMLTYGPALRTVRALIESAASRCCWRTSSHSERSPRSGTWPT